MTVFGLGVPERRSFRQPQFGSPFPCFPLLAGQPIPQGVDKVVVGELVVTPSRYMRCLSFAETFWVSRCDQP